MIQRVLLSGETMIGVFYKLKITAIKTLAQTILKNALRMEPGPGVSGKQIESLFPKNCKVYLGDANYNTVSAEEVERFNALWKAFGLELAEIKYSERLDCDNFADGYMGIAKLSNPTIALGWVWVHQDNGPNHALNFFVSMNLADRTYSYSLIEPQTGEILKPAAMLAYRPYLVRA